MRYADVLLGQHEKAISFGTAASIEDQMLPALNLMKVQACSWQTFMVAMPSVLDFAHSATGDKSMLHYLSVKGCLGDLPACLGHQQIGLGSDPVD